MGICGIQSLYSKGKHCKIWPVIGSNDRQNLRALHGQIAAEEQIVKLSVRAVRGKGGGRALNQSGGISHAGADALQQLRIRRHVEIAH